MFFTLQVVGDHRWSVMWDSSSPCGSSSFLVPTEVLQEIGHGHAEEETRAESEKQTTKSEQSAVNTRHRTSYSPPRCTTPVTEPNSAAETTGGPPSGATNETRGTKERASTATLETSSEGPVQLQPQTSMELDWHPGKKIKEEPEARDEVEAAPPAVASGRRGTPVNGEQGPLLPVKIEPIDPSWQSLAASLKREPEDEGGEAGVQVWTNSSSTQTCSAECKDETAILGKRTAGGSRDPEVGSKRRHLCPEDVPETTANPSGHLTGVEDGNATEKALLEDVKPTRAQLDKGEHCRIYLGCFWKGSPAGL